MGSRFDLTAEQRAALRRRSIKRRVAAYGIIFGLIYGFFLWVPWEYEVFVSEMPPSRSVDPDSIKLFAPGTKILLVTAHPDDSEFYIGGTLSRLGKTGTIHQVIVTDGDKGYYGPLTDATANLKIRKAEATEALRTFGGKSIEFLGYPDGRLKVDPRLVDDLSMIIKREKPEYILSFDPEFPPRARHGDHRKSGVATLEGARKAGFKGWMMLFSTRAPNFIVDVTQLWSEKERLLAIHESQFPAARRGGVSNMVRGSAEEQGSLIGVPLGEGFRCMQLD